MPIYEFYCADCHTVFNFFARRPDTAKRPACPRCGRPELERTPSRFAIGWGGSGPPADDAMMPDIDEEKMERAMAQMAAEVEGLNEDDPRQMAHMMRRLYETTGMPMGEGMDEAMRRLEAGEDPDKIEEQMGDVLEQEDPLFGQSGHSLKGLSRRARPPRVDETLYDL